MFGLVAVANATSHHTIDAGQPQEVQAGESVILQGTITNFLSYPDPTFDGLTTGTARPTYTWTQQGTPAIDLSPAASESRVTNGDNIILEPTTFTAPNTAVTLTFLLTVAGSPTSDLDTGSGSKKRNPNNRGIRVTDTVIVTVVAISDAPTDLIATSTTGGTGATLTWTAPANNSGKTTITGYVIQRAEGTSGDTFTDVTPAHSGIAATYTDSGLTSSTAYRYRVAAINSVGSSAYSVVASVTTDPPTAPDAPTGLSATSSADGTGATLSWTAPANNGAAISGYVIQRAEGTSGDTFTDVTPAYSGTAATYTDSGLTVGTAYRYQVAAVNSVGTSGYSGVVTVLPGASQEDIQQLNEAIAPRLVQSAVASTIASLGNRIDIAFSGIPQTASYQLDGQNIQLDGKTSLSNNLQATLLQKLPSHARSLTDGTMDWKHALGNSSFALPLNATDGAGDGTGSNLAVWGSGNYTKLSGDGDVDWDGDVVSVQLGVDNRVRDVLVGGMVSWSKGETDYTQNAQKGEYTHTITSIHPYLAWSNAGINLWSSVGYGQGKLELTEATRTTETDTKLLSLAAGVKGAISDKPGFSIKSDIALVRVDIDAWDSIIPEQRIDSQRLRVLLESARARRLASGSMFTPIMELGLRYDGGDGDTGVGALLGAGVRYTNASGLSVQGKLHTLIGRNDYEEWGISGVIRQQTGVGGRGLAFSLRPSYGPSDTTAAGADTLWEQNQSVDNQGATDYSMRVNADISYGLSAPGGRGLLIPYSEATLGDVNRYRLGLRWKRNARLEMNLFGEEQAGKHTVLVESRIRF